MPDKLPLRGLRALVIEDEYFIADDLKRLLRQQGAESVRLSGSVDDALAQIRDDGFEFGLLDINIRGGGTFLVADALRRKNVPFAFVSGYDRRSIPLRFDEVPNWGNPTTPGRSSTGSRPSGRGRQCPEEILTARS